MKYLLDVNVLVAWSPSPAEVQSRALALPVGSTLEYIDVGRLEEIDRQFLVERQLISREHADSEGARGVAIDVGSPASDALGRSGMAGGVKNFFWERFGAALLFSSLNDAASIAASEVSDADNVTRVPSQASDTILREIGRASCRERV